MCVKNLHAQHRQWHWWLVRTVVAGTAGLAGSRHPMGIRGASWGGGDPNGEALNA